MPQGWTREEVEATVADYFQMLDRELRGLPVNKAEQRRTLAPTLHSRTQQSIEFKRANISAILIELGFPFVVGYKPRSNYQHLLREIVVERLAAAPDLIRLAAQDAERVPPVPSFDDILGALTEPPKSKAVRESSEVKHPYSRSSPPPTNFLELEANNRLLGLAGEQFVLAYERARLLAAGLERLAGAVEHVAKTRGDGLGYDILSFDSSGAERLVEVKTTKYGAEAPFFLTRNEVAVSEGEASKYHLYRVYDFRARSRLFTLPGALRRTCTLEPQTFSARVA